MILHQNHLEQLSGSELKVLKQLLMVNFKYNNELKQLLKVFSRLSKRI